MKTRISGIVRLDAGCSRSEQGALAVTSYSHFEDENEERIFVDFSEKWERSAEAIYDSYSDLSWKGVGAVPSGRYSTDWHEMDLVSGTPADVFVPQPYIGEPGNYYKFTAWVTSPVNEWVEALEEMVEPPAGYTRTRIGDPLPPGTVSTSSIL